MLNKTLDKIGVIFIIFLFSVIYSWMLKKTLYKFLYLVNTTLLDLRHFRVDYKARVQLFAALCAELFLNLID